VAELLLKQGADIHAASDGWNAMHIAAFLNNREMVDLFIAHGARPDIFAAAALGDSDCVRALLQKSPALVHQKGPDGATPLHVAGTVEVARLLLEAGANIEALDDFYHNTPAEYNSNNREVVRFLISQGANVKFHLACWIGDAHRVQRFLQEQPELAHMRKGNDRPEGESLPVTIAAIAGEAEIVGLLLDHGVDSSTYDEVRGATPLHFAALWGHLDTARVLVERGANVSAPAYNGSTPLAWAIRGEQEGWGKFNRDPDPPRHQEIIQLLRQHSAGE
jgi:ankyrin repeat protein